ncbi:hypothetical protein [Rhizobium sp. CC-YZS058]|uniref:hypothetical protein n=1 Tax=Rhizobium sp. CC-YZS058 TaxID=3042153 RepID=UPI002B05DCAE|nr:hypothetical protein [Rhizobium sp. CC-YZS058]MEA3537086.1 hypothetical protein [Rhizobium sp. CC-YZS058]
MHQRVGVKLDQKPPSQLGVAGQADGVAGPRQQHGIAQFSFPLDATEPPRGRGEKRLALAPDAVAKPLGPHLVIKKCECAAERQGFLNTFRGIDGLPQPSRHDARRRDRGSLKSA